MLNRAGFATVSASCSLARRFSQMKPTKQNSVFNFVRTLASRVVRCVQKSEYCVNLMAFSYPRWFKALRSSCVSCVRWRYAGSRPRRKRWASAVPLTCPFLTQWWRTSQELITCLLWAQDHRHPAWPVLPPPPLSQVRKNSTAICHFVCALHLHCKYCMAYTSKMTNRR